MGIGTKRICQSCGSKFYDLEKDPIICPKCNTVYNLETANKPKRGRKKAGSKPEAQADEEIEISLDDDAIEELDDDAALEEMDDEMREEMGTDDEGAHHEKSGDKVLVDLEEDNADIIESDDGHTDKE